jgi:hypothetical protein
MYIVLQVGSCFKLYFTWIKNILFLLTIFIRKIYDIFKINILWVFLVCVCVLNKLLNYYVLNQFMNRNIKY